MYYVVRHTWQCLVYYKCFVCNFIIAMQSLNILRAYTHFFKNIIINFSNANNYQKQFNRTIKIERNSNLLLYTQ